MMEGGLLEASELRATRKENSTAAVCSAVPWYRCVHFSFSDHREPPPCGPVQPSVFACCDRCRCDPQENLLIHPTIAAELQPFFRLSHPPSSHHHVAHSSLDLTLPLLDASDLPSLAYNPAVRFGLSFSWSLFGQPHCRSER